MVECLAVCGFSFAALFVGTYYFFYRKKSDDSLKDKVVLIVGASSGIGEACAHTFYKHNCKLILCARRLSELERVKKEVESANKETTKEGASRITLIQLDISNFDDIFRIVNECLQIYNSIDILINNAGISYRGKIIDTDLSVDRSVMDVNYFGQVAVTKVVLKSMVDKKAGHIVFVSSLQGKLSIPHRSAYSASKHAVQAFADCLRAETYQFNIGVSVISPAYVRTNLSINAVTSAGSKHGRMDDNQKSGMHPDDVADAVVDSIVYNNKEVLLAKFTYRAVVYCRNIFADVYFYMMAKRARETI